MLLPPREALGVVTLSSLDDPRGSPEAASALPWAIRAADAIRSSSAWRGARAGGRDGGHNHARNPAAPLTRIIRGYLRCCARCSGVIKPRCAARGHVFKHVRRVGVRSFQDQQTVTAAENQLHYLHQDERPGGCSGVASLAMAPLALSRISSVRPGLPS